MQETRMEEDRRWLTAWSISLRVSNLATGTNARGIDDSGTEMFITVNLPGSKNFEWFQGTRKACLDWDDKKAEEFKSNFGGAWFSAYSGGKLMTNKEAKRWRYKDGTKVFDLK